MVIYCAAADLFICVHSAVAFYQSARANKNCPANNQARRTQYTNIAYIATYEYTIYICDIGCVVMIREFMYMRLNAWRTWYSYRYVLHTQ